jgi:hypothetical protein
MIPYEEVYIQLHLFNPESKLVFILDSDIKESTTVHKFLASFDFNTHEGKFSAPSGKIYKVTELKSIQEVNRPEVVYIQFESME